MTKYLVILTLLIPSLAMSEDTIVDLGIGDSVLATCTGDPVECPTCPPVGEEDRYATHGPTHKDALKLKTIDCRNCHGDDLMGSERSVTSRQRGCIAPDGFAPPDNNQEIWTMDPYGIEYNPAGKSAALFSAGVVVGCNNCHKEVEYKVNGQEVKGKFEDWRKSRIGEDEEDDD